MHSFKTLFLAGAIAAPALALAETHQPLVIRITAAGIVQVEGRQASGDELNRALADYAAKISEPQVRIEADEKAALEVMRKVMDACRKNGITRISVVSK